MTYKKMVDETVAAAANTKNDVLNTFESITSDNKNDSPTESIQSAYEKRRIEDSKSKSEFLYAVNLPFPNEFSDSQAHQWDNANDIRGEIMTGVQGSTVDLGIVKLNVGKTIGSLSNAYGVRKPVANPGYFQNYSGSEPRKFRLTWVFIPNSSEEADELFTIIYNLKKYTLPKAANNGESKLVLLAPYVFDITTKSKTLNMLTRMSDLVCDNFDIMYPSKAQFYPNGSPKYIQLTLSFAENSMLYADDY